MDAGQGAAGRLVVVRGTGSMGTRYLRILRDRIRVRTVALPVRGDRVDELRRHGFEAVRSRDDIPRSGTVSSIVATDTHRHLKDAGDLIPLGNVLIEKPLAATADGLGPFATQVRAAGNQ